MLSLVITLLIIALIAGILGFGGIAGAAVGIAENRVLCRASAVRHFTLDARAARRVWSPALTAGGLQLPGMNSGRADHRRPF